MEGEIWIFTPILDLYLLPLCFTSLITFHHLFFAFATARFYRIFFPFPFVVLFCVFFSRLISSHSLCCCCGSSHVVRRPVRLVELLALLNGRPPSINAHPTQ